MITGLGIGLLGFGLVVAYAGVTGQKLGEELRAVFTGTKAPGRNQAAAGALAAGATYSPPPAPVRPLNPLPGGIRPGTDTGNILEGYR